MYVDFLKVCKVWNQTISRWKYFQKYAKLRSKWTHLKTIFNDHFESTSTCFIMPIMHYEIINTGIRFKLVISIM